MTMTEIKIIIIAMLFAACIAFFVSTLLIGRATALNKRKAGFRDYSNSPVCIFEHRVVSLSDVLQIIEKKEMM